MFKGTLKTWKDDRGFGFIKPDDDSNDIFVHISAFDSTSRRPWKGDVIYYQIQQDKGGKIKAVNARIEGETVEKSTGTRKFVYIGAGLIVLALLAGLVARYLGLI
ncbi:MAG: cold shock domain-containing protein [Gammaproteobacteria bacterium]